MMKAYISYLPFAVFILLFSFPRNGYALSSRNFKIISDNKGRELVVEESAYIYQEQEKWIVETFSRDERSLPNRKFYKVFDSYYQALNEYNHQSSKQYDQSSIYALELPIIDTEVKNSKIWEATQVWSALWEQRFSDWVLNEIDLEFFRRYKLKVDCADVGLTLRWIFSFIHKLPVANSLALNGQLITHETFRRKYRNLKRSDTWHKDEVLLEALKDLNESANTKSIINDLYPVELSQDFIRPGVIYMTRGHVRMVKRVTQDGSQYPIEFTYGTVPASLNVYREYFFIQKNQLDRSYGGFLSFRWPVLKDNQWVLSKEQAMSGYSHEQYAPRYLNNFYKEVFKKLSLAIKPKMIIKSIVSNMKELLEVRKSIVDEGYEICQVSDCSDKSSGSLYDEWSTPSRDKRTRALFISLSNFSFSSKLLQFKNQQLKKTTIELINKDVSLFELENYFAHKLVSGDPRDPVEVRWGFDHESLARKRREEIQEAQSKVVISSYCSDRKCDNEQVIRQISYSQSILQKIDENLENYIKLCYYSKTANCELEKDISLLNYSLAPYLFINDKPIVNKPSYKFLPYFDRSLEQASNRYIIVDHKRVFDIQKSLYVMNSQNTEALFYISRTGGWLELSLDDRINTYDKNFQQIKSEYLGESVSYKKIRFISQDHFLLSVCQMGVGCSYKLLTVDLSNKLSLKKTYRSAMMLRAQKIDSILHDSREGICFKNYIKKQDDCYFESKDQTKLVSITQATSTPYLYGEKLYYSMNQQLRITNLNHQKVWNTQIKGRILVLMKAFDNFVFIATDEKKNNCHLLNFNMRSRETTSCSPFIKPYILQKQKSLYIQDRQKQWKKYSHESQWTELYDKKDPIGQDENSQLVFLSDLNDSESLQVSCLSHYDSGYYPCHGNQLKMNVIKSQNRLIVRDSSDENQRYNFWAPSYYRAQRIRLFEGYQLTKMSKFLYLLKTP